MNDERNTETDLIVDRAVRALRDTPVPPGPPPEVLQAVLGAGEPGESGARRRTLAGRIFKMNHILAAAAAVIVVGIAVAALFTAGNGGASSAWAAVQEKVRNAQTLSCKVIQRTKGAPDFKIQVMALGDGRVRQEMVIMGEPVTHIMDINKGKILILTASDKQAVQISVPSLSEQMAKLRENDWMTRLKKLIERPHSELGEKSIIGTKARGYQVSKDGQEMTLWVDADTGDILEITIEMFEGDAQVILSDFELDKELDESQFSFEIPEGYALAPTGALEIREATDEDIVAFLKFWAKARGDTFPDTLTEAEWFKDCLKQVAGMEKDVSAEEMKKWAEQMGSARLFLQMHPETAAQYAGKGVKLGEADKIVLWYKRSKDDEAYTGIYGDLSIEDVAEEDLPARAEQNVNGNSQPQETPPEPAPAADYAVSEEDEWTVVSSEEIRARSTLVIRKFPQTYKHLILQLPFQKATVQKVRLGEKDLPFSRPKPNEYHVDLSSGQGTTRPGRITVLWTFSPAACLAPSETGRYWTPLKSLAPSDSFSLTVTIADGSGFRFSFGDSGARTVRGFKSSPGKPKMDYGKWGGLMGRKDGHTGGAQ